VFPRGRVPLWLNPNTAGDPGDPNCGGRFHPFESALGTRVPTIYLASSLKAALCESLLHDLSLTPPEHPYTLSLSKAAESRFSICMPTAGLPLIDLSGLGADRIRIPNELMSWCAREDYPTSRSAARLLHTKYGNAAGVRWISRRYPPAECVVIFGDRVCAIDSIFSCKVPEHRDFHAPGTPGYVDFEAVILEAGITAVP
jgi:hypothetical protein